MTHPPYDYIYTADFEFCYLFPLKKEKLEFQDTEKMVINYEISVWGERLIKGGIIFVEKCPLIFSGVTILINA